MEERTITRIPAMPLALMLGTIGAIFGLIGGLIAAASWTAIMSTIAGMPNYQGHQHPFQESSSE